jgi:hypothetical protein
MGKPITNVSYFVNDRRHTSAHCILKTKIYYCFRLCSFHRWKFTPKTTNLEVLNEFGHFIDKNVIV